MANTSYPESSTVTKSGHVTKYRHVVTGSGLVVLIAPFISLMLPQIASGQNSSSPLGLCNSASGSSIAYTCNPSSVVFSYVKNITTSWTPDVTNTTTTPTLNLGPGAKNLKDATGNNVLVGSIVAGSVYVVAYDNTSIRIVSGPVIVPVVANIQQFTPLICYDSNGAHTTAFSCSRTPSGASLSRGSVVLFGFAGNVNGANPTLDVEGNGGAGIVLSNSSPVPTGSMSGDASGTPNYYLLVKDADNDNWIMLNQLLPAAVVFINLPTCNSSTEGFTRVVSDANTSTWGATIAGGGGNRVLAYCNTSNWTVMGR